MNDPVPTIVLGGTGYVAGELLRLIAVRQRDDSSVYAAAPPRPDEFTTDDEPLSWEAEGWEQFG